MRREDYDDAGWGRVLQDRWDRLQQLVDSGTLETHPLIDGWNEHSKLLRDAQRAKDAGGSGLGARELLEANKPRPQTAQDDPLGSAESSPPGGHREKGKTAMDSLIPGYSRLLHANRDTRVVDENRIVQSPPRGW